MKHKAFISYSHQTGKPYAVALEEALKKYARPLWKFPFSIFRDEHSLTPNLALNEKLRQELDGSEYFLFLASPESAGSPWCDEEVLYWCKDPNRVSNMIIILIGGEISVDIQKNEIDWERTDALPRELSSYIPTIPLYVDLRRIAEKDLQLNNSFFKTEINRISALFQEISPEAMISKQTKVTRMNRLVLAGLIAAVIFASITGTLLTYLQYSEAKKNLAGIYMQSAIQSEQAGYYDAAAIYGAAALAKSEDLLGAGIYAKELHKIPKPINTHKLSDKPISYVKFMHNNEFIVVRTEEGRVIFLESKGLKLIKEISQPDLLSFALSQDQTKAGLGFEDGRVVVCDLIFQENQPSLKNQRLIETIDQVPKLLDFSYDNRFLAIGADDLYLKDLKTPDKKCKVFPSSRKRKSGKDYFTLTSLKFAHHSYRLALGDAWGFLADWQASGNASEDPFDINQDLYSIRGDIVQPGLKSIAFNQDDRSIYTAASIQGGISYYNEINDYGRFPSVRDEQCYDIVVSKDGNNIVSCSKVRADIEIGGLDFYTYKNIPVQAKMLTFVGDSFQALDLSENGRTLVTGTTHGKIILWNLSNVGEGLQTETSIPLAAIKISPDNQHLLKLYDNKNIELQNIGTKQNGILLQDHEAIASHFYGNGDHLAYLCYGTDPRQSCFVLKLVDLRGIKAVFKEILLPLSGVKEFAIPASGSSVVLITGGKDNIDAAYSMSLNGTDARPIKMNLPMQAGEEIEQAGFSPDSALLAICTPQQVFIISTDTPEFRLGIPRYQTVKTENLEGANRVVFSSDRNQTLFYDSRSVYLRQGQRDQRIYQLPTTEVYGPYIKEVTYYHGFTRIAVLFDSGELSFYDAADPSRRLEKIHLGTPNTCSHTLSIADGKGLVGTVGLDRKSIRIYDLANILTSFSLSSRDGRELLDMLKEKYHLDFQNGQIVRSKEIR